MNGEERREEESGREREGVSSPRPIPHSPDV